MSSTMNLKGQGLSRFKRNAAKRKHQADHGLRQKRPIVMKHAAIDRHDEN